MTSELIDYETIRRYARQVCHERRDISRNAKKSPLPNRAVHELLKDSRIPDARAKMQISRPTLRTILDFLKVRFTPSYQALRALRAFRTTLRF